MNYSSSFGFVLHGLNETFASKHILFAFVFSFYMFTILVNLIVIVIIFLDKALHEPMYMFICNLCVNGIYGASCFYTKFLADMWSELNVVSYAECLAQIFVIYSYTFAELTSLSVMAHDRYVAICKPLNYRSFMTPWKVGKLILLTWLFPVLETTIGLILTLRLPMCGKDIERLYCSNWAVVKLSCVDTTVNNLYGYILMFYHVSQATLIIISYFHIIREVVKSEAQRNKFMQTCVPHLISLINFTASVMFDSLYARHGARQSLLVLQNILSVEFLVVPPLLNPVIYGMALSQIRSKILKLCRYKIKRLK
ncbi:olfactory receptor 2G3-like [Denticeps clupeoides]|uniref:olfactory receptor 2G3-like n=1 Tax=Denticeps clupeoides TaxID=299321 RepID=UPI0010A4599F|nr:olfactory receptor 2G3-like [Denticeps clupeoides]